MKRNVQRDFKVKDMLCKHIRKNFCSILIEAEDIYGKARKGGNRIRICVVLPQNYHNCVNRQDAGSRNPLQILHGDGCVTGGRPGLQNRVCGTNPVTGGFDSYTSPPLYLKTLYC